MLRALRIWRDAEARKAVAGTGGTNGTSGTVPAPTDVVTTLPAPADSAPAPPAPSATPAPGQVAYVRALPQGEAYREVVDRAPMQAWLAAVPVAVRPVALAGIYPRIVKRIMLLWDEEAALLAYVEDLVVDRRGGRIGFPPKVAGEIARLHEFIRVRAAVRRAAAATHGAEESPTPQGPRS